MKEIGGYFGLEQLVTNEHYNGLIPLNSGRNALLYLTIAKKIKKLYIPYYLCSEVRNMLKRYKCNFEYYNVDCNFLPKFTKYLTEDEYLYIVNYYGQINNEIIINLKKQYDKIILDYTHAFFQEPPYGIDTIYNCRKFFGVPDGAYLSTNSKINENLEIDISKDRMVHILGRYEETASKYYEDFQYNDKAFITEPLKYMSKLTHNILGAIDYESVCETRNKNYSYLNNKLGRYNKLKLNSPNGAFAYPFYIKNGISIRKKLANQKIYIPILWPNVFSDTPKNSIEYDYAANILPLPCDQRYGLNDMEFIAREVENCID